MHTRQPDVTRERILNTAIQEIHRHGFQAASLSNILAKTGLTKGALYRHFPDKNHLGYAVIEEVIRDGLDAVVCRVLRLHPPRTRGTVLRRRTGAGRFVLGDEKIPLAIHTSRVHRIGGRWRQVHHRR